ncbi:MAG: hypothetical protein ISS49_08445 [Anaerolineae bacterium]|nr:hypothetical protein [Anaerolineae bacterium]
MFKQISIGILAVVVLALGVTGVVLAQEPAPPAEGIPPFDGTQPGEGFGMRGMRGGRGMRGQPPPGRSSSLWNDASAPTTGCWPRRWRS